MSRILITGGAGFIGSHLTEQDKAYAAGFFDGEGCILVYGSDRLDKRDGKTRYRYDLICNVGQKTREPLDWLHQRFGGNINQSNVHRSYDGQLTKMWSWRLCGKRAGHFLSVIFPYLIVKRDEAHLGILFSQTVGLKESWVMPFRKHMQHNLREVRRYRNLRAA